MRFSAHQTGPGAHPASCKMGTASFPGVKSDWGVTLAPHPHLVPWSRKSRAIPLLHLCAIRPVQSLSACTRVHFTLPIPLLPLWAIRPVQSLSACTRVHFTPLLWRVEAEGCRFFRNAGYHLYQSIYCKIQKTVMYWAGPESNRAALPGNVERLRKVPINTNGLGKSKTDGITRLHAARCFLHAHAL